jgi:hypothetical protein
MLKIFQAENEIKKHLEKNEARIPGILERLIARAGASAGGTISATVLSGAVRGYGVDGEKSALRSEGFKFVQRSRKRRGFIAAGYFWAHAANIYENFKSRRRVYLTRAAKKFFEQSSAYESSLAAAVQELVRE